MGTHGSIESRASLPLGLAILLCLVSSVAKAQTPQAITARLLFPPRNYEIALRDTLQPVVRLRNTDNVAHSVITVEYRIRNVVTLIKVYDDTIVIPSLGAGDGIDLKLTPYATNPNILSELGTFDACLIVGDGIAGDTTCARLFGLRRTSQPYRDPSNNYSKSIIDQRSTAKIDAPDQVMWVSLGAQVVEGEDSTWDPPPPRDLNGGGYGPDTMHSPVMRLDRKDLAGNFYSGSGVGDTLTSFPINLLGQTRANLFFDYARGSRTHYPLGWDAAVMQGPEPTLLGDSGRVVRPGDSLILEFKKPGEPATNPTAWDEIAAIDGGHDFEFQPFIARLSRYQDTNSWWIMVNGITREYRDTSNYFNADFRFRFRLKAKNDALASPPPVDDADPWYIDNPTLLIPRKPEIEVRWIRVVNPYTKVPRSQATLPVCVDVMNHSTDIAIPFTMRVDMSNPGGDTVYSQRMEVTDLWAAADTVLQFPAWDASDQVGNEGASYIASAMLDQPGWQSQSDIEETYSKFFLNVESGNQAVQEFALDDAGIAPAPGSGNDIPQLTGVPGSGTGFNNATGSLAMKFQLAHRDTIYGVRLYFGSANSTADPIRISVLDGGVDGSSPPYGTSGVTLGSFYTNRPTGSLDQFSTYYFPQPVALVGGSSYWIAVSQLSLSSMELGGDISRGGARFNSAHGRYPDVQAMYGHPYYGPRTYGTQWGSRPEDNSGDVSTSWAVEHGAGSGYWDALMPNFSWIAFSDHLQPNIMLGLDTISWTGAGVYAPMIRPMIGHPPSSSVGSADKLPSFALQGSYPNPFDPAATSTTIGFALPEQSPVSLVISNILGVAVRTLVTSALSPGAHSVSWDGRDERGARVPAGPYLFELTSGGRRATAKLIVTE